MPARKTETTFNGVFRTLPNIYDRAFLSKIVNDSQKTPSKTFERVLSTPLMSHFFTANVRS